MSISASKTEHLFSRIPCSGYFFIENVTHTKTLNFSLLLDGLLLDSLKTTAYTYTYIYAHTPIYLHIHLFFI